MGSSRFYRSLIIIAFIAAGCSEGGQSGTGIASSIVGNVAAVGGTADVSEIQVTIAGSAVMGATDLTGGFSLMGDISGPKVLVFERERDDLLAEANIVVPAGGRLELGDIEIDVDEGRATPTRRSVEFEGILQVVDCIAGELQVVTRLEGIRTLFVVPLNDAFIHDDSGREVPCEALSPGIEVEVKGAVDSDGLLSNADVEVENETEDDDRHNDGTDDEGEKGEEVEDGKGPEDREDEADKEEAERDEEEDEEADIGEEDDREDAEEAGDEDALQVSESGNAFGAVEPPR